METIRSSSIEHHNQIPTLRLSELSGLGDKMREACEKYGCFMLKCEEMIPKELREQMLASTKGLFDLPDETKQRHWSSKPYRSYEGNSPVVLLSESFGIDNGSRPDSVEAFTRLMWPNGNHSFCESVSEMGEKLTELGFTILRMVLESLGMEKHYDSHVQGTSVVLRLMKYRVGDSAQLGLVAHTDKSALTIVFQNEVQGLEILTKQGKWIQLNIPESSYVVFVGDALKAWSNGRFHAATHRVMLRGERKERYSCGLFLVPKEGFTIEVPKELVDKDHPLLYRPFNFSDYFSFFVSNLGADALEIFAGQSDFEV